MNLDLFNALFEFGGGLFILNHCRVLHLQKKVRGISFIAGLLIVAANALWVGMLLYYRKND